ncbi:MAG: alpha/beta fold hydrolase [Pseudolabrys sp.]
MTLSLNGRTIDYEEAGTGLCLLFVPGSFSTTAAWRSVGERLKDRFRIVSTSLPGYGRTPECRTAASPPAAAEAEIVEAVAGHTGGPVHLIGHSFGGVICAAVALRRRVELKSLIFLEANICDLLRQAGNNPLYDEARRFSDGFIAAFQAGEADAARRVIDFWAGPGTFDRLPQAVRDYAIRTTPANILDWPSMYGLDHSLADYAAIACPVLVIRGSDSNPVARRIAEILAGICPHARLADIAGASHLMAGTHPGEVAALIAQHVEAAERAKN